MIVALRTELDEASPTPLHLQLADLLRIRVREGSVRVGDALLSARELATPKEAKLSSIPPAAAVQCVERQGHLSNGTPVELTRSVYRGGRYDVVVEVREAATGMGS